MTREEAIEILSRPKTMKNVPDNIMEAHSMAIKALEQEPCEDAISRQAVLEKAVYTETEEGWWGYTVDVEYIKSLPPVNPEPNTGHWIIHPKGIYAHLICDKCLSNAPYDCRTNYCPNCGRRMVEPQESEVNNADSN